MRPTDSTFAIPPVAHGLHRYPSAPRTRANQRYHFIETQHTEEQPYQRPSRQRMARLTSAQTREAIDDHNVDLLNAIAAQRKLPGYEVTKIACEVTKVSLFVNKPLQPQDELTIEYGGPYWQIFWHHLSLDQQRGMKTQYPDVTFPPHWPQVVPSGYRNQAQLSQLEHDYSLAARNIYDVLSMKNTLDEVENYSDSDEHGATEKMRGESTIHYIAAKEATI
jgi:hypothetical protein